MGTVFDAVAPETATRHYEELDGPLSREQEECRRNRRMLYNAMVAAGFSNYEAEWWHYQYGNQMHAVCTDEPAIYGATRLSSDNLAWEKMRALRHAELVEKYGDPLPSTHPLAALL